MLEGKPSDRRGMSMVYLLCRTMTDRRLRVFYANRIKWRKYGEKGKHNAPILQNFSEL
jgi:hypothetical protein